MQTVSKCVLMSVILLVLGLMVCATPDSADAQAPGDLWYVGRHPITRAYTLVYTSRQNPALINGPATLARSGYTQVYGPATRPACVSYLRSVGAPGWR